MVEVYCIDVSNVRLVGLCMFLFGEPPEDTVVKSLSASAGDPRDISLIPRLGEGNVNPLQYSCLENSRQKSLGGYSP